MPSRDLQGRKEVAFDLSKTETFSVKTWIKEMKHNTEKSSMINWATKTETEATVTEISGSDAEKDDSVYLLVTTVPSDAFSTIFCRAIGKFFAGKPHSVLEEGGKAVGLVLRFNVREDAERAYSEMNARVTSIGRVLLASVDGDGSLRFDRVMCGYRVCVQSPKKDICSVIIDFKTCGNIIGFGRNEIADFIVIAYETQLAAQRSLELSGYTVDWYGCNLPYHYRRSILVLERIEFEAQRRRRVSDSDFAIFNPSVDAIIGSVHLRNLRRAGIFTINGIEPIARKPEISVQHDDDEWSEDEEELTDHETEETAPDSKVAYGMETPFSFKRLTGAEIDSFFWERGRVRNLTFAEARRFDEQEYAANFTFGDSTLPEVLDKGPYSFPRAQNMEPVVLSTKAIEQFSALPRPASGESVTLSSDEYTVLLLFDWGFSSRKRIGSDTIHQFLVTAEDMVQRSLLEMIMKAALKWGLSESCLLRIVRPPHMEFVGGDITAWATACITPVLNAHKAELAAKMALQCDLYGVARKILTVGRRCINHGVDDFAHSLLLWCAQDERQYLFDFKRRNYVQRTMLTCPAACGMIGSAKEIKDHFTSCHTGWTFNGFDAESCKFCGIPVKPRLPMLDLERLNHLVICDKRPACFKQAEKEKYYEYPEMLRHVYPQVLPPKDASSFLLKVEGEKLKVFCQ